MHKLSHLSGDQWVEHSHAAHFAVESNRVVAGVPRGDTEVFERLVAALEPPYFLLYVLHTPRGEGEPGRYQSPPLVLVQVREFITRFKEFLSKDARFDIWAHSSSENATIVWERHNLLYAYGPLEIYLRELHALGFTSGTPGIPAPHAHNYRRELDHYAKELLSTLEWSWSELRPEDEQ